MLAIPGTWTHYFRLKDKFDDNGLVGIMIATPSTAEPLVWELDTWLMSCRVIGRQLENFMFNTLMAAARERGVVAIRGLYLPTPKNGMVANLYPELGFLDVSSGSQGTRIFQIDPAQAPLRPAAFIEDRA
jgi:FkbH-like protein